jgi:hypothetical protein
MRGTPDLSTWAGVASALEAHLQSAAFADTGTNHWVKPVDLPFGVDLTPAALDDNIVHFAISSGYSEGSLIRVVIETLPGRALIPVLVAKSLSSPRRAVADLVAMKEAGRRRPLPVSHAERERGRHRSRAMPRLEAGGGWPFGMLSPSAGDVACRATKAS